MESSLPVTRMYTHADGHTRFKPMFLPLDSRQTSGSIGLFSDLFVNPAAQTNAKNIKMQFALTPAPKEKGVKSPTLNHTAPRKQLVITLNGHLEFTSAHTDANDAEHRIIINSGHILLAEDLDKTGHTWRFIHDEQGKMLPWLRCYIHLGNEYEHFISRLVF